MVIVQRLESFDVICLSWMFLGIHMGVWTLANATLTVIGVLIALLVPALGLLAGSSDLKVDGLGVVFTVLAGISFTASMTITMRELMRVPTWVLCLFRTLLPAVLFNCLLAGGALGTKGLSIYSSGIVWAVLTPYALLYVFLLQLLVIKAVKEAHPLSIAIASNVSFILQLAWSAALLHSTPPLGECFGVLTILLSIVSSSAEVYHRSRHGDLGSKKQSRQPSREALARQPECRTQKKKRRNQIQHTLRQQLAVQQQRARLYSAERGISIGEELAASLNLNPRAFAESDATNDSNSCSSSGGSSRSRSRSSSSSSCGDLGNRRGGDIDNSSQTNPLLRTLLDVEETTAEG